MKSQNNNSKTHAPRILSSSELEQVAGGVMKSRHDTVKNSLVQSTLEEDEIMKSRHETAKNAIGNVR
jgi:hypothetical protein